MKKPYRYSLRKNSSHYYSYSNRALVQINGFYEVGDIMNWKEVVFEWIRHERYHGIFNKQAKSVKFVKEAAYILRELYHKYGGIMAQCEFVIEVLDSTTQQYQVAFTSYVDFSMYKSYRDHVEVALIESGLSAMITAYENTVYEIPVDDSDCIKVNMDGITLKTRYRYLNPTYAGTLNNVGFIFNLMILPYVNRQEGDLSAGVGESQTEAFPATLPPLFTANYDTVAVVIYDFTLRFTPYTANNGIKIEIETWSGSPRTTSLLAVETIYTSATITAGNTVTVAIKDKRLISMAPNNTLCVKIKMLNTFVTGTINYVINLPGETQFIIDTQTNSAQSTDRVENTRKGYRWHTVLDKLIRKMSNNLYSLENGFTNNRAINHNDYYNAIPYDVIIIPEQSLKKLRDNPVIKVKLSDMLKDAFTRMQVGFGIENNKLVAKEIDDFYDGSQVMFTISSVESSGMMLEADPDAAFSTVEAGYDGGDAIDDINRLNAFNTKQIRTSSITSFQDRELQVWDMMSPFYAECQYIELTRIQNVKSKVTVNNTQKSEANLNFLVHVLQVPATDGIYDLNRPFVNGVDFQDVYNAGLSPTRNLLRCTNLIKSKLYGLNNKQLVFQTSEQNQDFLSTFNTTVGVVIEDKILDFDILPGNAIYQPYLIKVKAASPVKLADFLSVDPYRAVGIKYRGRVLYGFLMQAGISPAMPATYEYILRPVPGTDPDDLIFNH